MTLNSLQETSLGPACTLTSSEEWDLGWALNGLMPKEQTVRSERRNGIEQDSSEGSTTQVWKERREFAAAKFGKDSGKSPRHVNQDENMCG